MFIINRTFRHQLIFFTASSLVFKSNEIIIKVAQNSIDCEMKKYDNINKKLGEQKQDGGSPHT